MFKSCAPFTDCISKINNTQIDNAKDIDVVMQMYNLIEYSSSYSKTVGSLWHNYRDEPNDITESESFKSNIKKTEKTPNESNTKSVEIAKPLNYLGNFWRKIIVNSEINLILTWFDKCVLSTVCKNYCNNWSQVLTNNYLEQRSIKSNNTSAKPIFRFLLWSNFLRSK